MPTCSRQARIRFGAFLIILRVASTIQLHKTFLKCNDSKVMNVLNVQKKWFKSNGNPGEWTGII